MWTELQIKNFKGFADTGLLKLKPINVLIGPNSSGKSSILKAFLLLKQTVESSDFSSHLVTNGNYLDLGGFREIVHKEKLDSEIEFYLSWDPFYFPKLKKQLPNVHPFLAPQMSFSGLKMSFIRKTDGQIVLKNLDFKSENDSIISLKRSPKGGYSVIIETPFAKKMLKFSASRLYIPSKFYFFSSEFLGDVYKKDSIVFHFLKELPGLIERLSYNNYYLGPLRDYPKRSYTLTGETTPRDVGSKGEDTIKLLVLEKDKKNLLELLSYWLDKLKVAESAIIKSKGADYQLLIKDMKSEFSINISDTGFGASQIIPVIIESIYSPRFASILIEQPEIHLNPLVQSNLADLFIDIAKSKDYKKQFIIETHSEHIINRIRRRIAEGKTISGDNFTTDDVNIFYCYKENGECKIRNLTINDLGQIEDWPEGFFEEEYRDMNAQMDAIFKKTGDE